MLLNNRASYSSSITQRQWGLASALWIEVGTDDNNGGATTAETCRQSTSLETLIARRVTIGWVLRGVTIHDYRVVD
jgi:hypothetical protein